MTRRTAKALHASLIVVGALLYFLFILPRWWVLTGSFPSTLATVGRIAAGIPIALAAVPVLAVLKGSIKPTAHAPELALRLRAWSALLHVIAGGLILIVAIIEIWLTMTSAGPVLFALYGAAGAIAVLGVLAFYLSYDAEKPPAEPKPAKEPEESAEPKSKKFAWRKRGTAAVTVTEVDETDVVVDEDIAADGTAEADTVVVTETVETETVDTDTVEPEADTATSGGLRNKRPTGKRRLRS